MKATVCYKIWSKMPQEEQKNSLVVGYKIKSLTQNTTERLISGKNHCN